MEWLTSIGLAVYHPAQWAWGMIGPMIGKLLGEQVVKALKPTVKKCGRWVRRSILRRDTPPVESTKSPPGPHRVRTKVMIQAFVPGDFLARSIALEATGAMEGGSITDVELECPNCGGALKFEEEERLAGLGPRQDCHTRMTCGKCRYLTRYGGPASRIEDHLTQMLYRAQRGR